MNATVQAVQRSVLGEGEPLLAPIHERCLAALHDLGTPNFVRGESGVRFVLLLVGSGPEPYGCADQQHKRGNSACKD